MRQTAASSQSHIRAQFTSGKAFSQDSRTDKASIRFQGGGDFADAGEQMPSRCREAGSGLKKIPQRRAFRARRAGMHEAPQTPIRASGAAQKARPRRTPAGKIHIFLSPVPRLL